jgi:hypothetical protein
MINSNFGFTPLREVWLGDCYPESYYDHLPNEIADPFRLITQWTREDLNRLQAFLESRGIRVRRPEFTSIDDYMNDQDQLTRPPITPRDDYLTLGTTLYSLHNTLKKDPWQTVMDEYIAQGFDVRAPKDTPMNCLRPPSMVRVGHDIYIDKVTHEHVWGFVCEAMIELAQDYRVNICDTDGHSDGIFCPVARNILVNSHYKGDYSQSFPEWELFPIKEIKNNVHNMSAYAWVLNEPSIDNNRAFADHIARAAANWVGNVRETVFEVNMLVLDEQNVIAMKEHPELRKYLESRGITMHYFDFRTRGFWDGGWHCLTLDIHREDTKEDLFPERGENGVYWRLR